MNKNFIQIKARMVSFLFIQANLLLLLAFFIITILAFLKE